MEKEFISPKGLYEFPSYTQVVKAGNTVYIAGQTGIDENGEVVEGGFEAQAVRTFENMKLALQSVGASFKDVVKLNGYFTTYDKDRPKYHELRSRYFDPPLPTATNVQVAKLAFPEMLLEVEAVAIIDD
jgi:2-iminobutanoate/2-iminopropanoate deaminase